MGLLFDFFRLLSIRNFQTPLVRLIEPVVLQSVHRHRRLQDVLEVHEAEEEFAARAGGLLYQSDALETREGAEYV